MTLKELNAESLDDKNIKLQELVGLTVIAIVDRDELTLPVLTISFNKGVHIRISPFGYIVLHEESKEVQ